MGHQITGMPLSCNSCRFLQKNSVQPQKNAGICRIFLSNLQEFQDFAGICRNLQEFVGICRNLSGTPGVCVCVCQGCHSPAIPAIPTNSCDSCKFLRFLQIPANSCKNSCKFLHFAVVAGIQLSFSTNLFDISILIIYLKVLICIFYYFISFPVIKIGNFEILIFFRKKVGLRKIFNFFF